jgi:hypothetical protein
MPTKSSWWKSGMPINDLRGARVEGIPSGGRELVMYGDLNVSAVVRGVDRSKALHVVLYEVAFVLKETTWTTDELVGGPISSAMNLQGYQLCHFFFFVLQNKIYPNLLPVKSTQHWRNLENKKS